MELRDLKAELSIKTIEFERALSDGTPRHELIKFYKELKELQYQFLLGKIKDRESSYDEIIE